MTIDYKKYPIDWKEIRARILKRAENRCECMGECGLHTTTGRCIEINGKKAKYAKGKIVLTIAHLDHDAENHKVKDNRLKALCQRCHNRYDVPFRKMNRFKNKHKNQLNLAIKEL